MNQLTVNLCMHACMQNIKPKYWIIIIKLCAYPILLLYRQSIIVIIWSYTNSWHCICTVMIYDVATTCLWIIKYCLFMDNWPKWVCHWKALRVKWLNIWSCYTWINITSCFANQVQKRVSAWTSTARCISLNNKLAIIYSQYWKDRGAWGWWLGILCITYLTLWILSFTYLDKLILIFCCPIINTCIHT